MSAKTWVWCSAHKKRAHATHAAAERLLAVVKNAAGMTVYPCGVLPDRWHLGHSHPDVVALDRVLDASNRGDR